MAGRFGPPFLDEANDPPFDNAGVNAEPIAEPSTNALVLFSAGLFLLRWPNRRRRQPA